MKRVRFGIKGIPVFPNAATFVKVMKEEDAKEFVKHWAQARLVLSLADPRLAAKFFVEVQDQK
jgi:hypothetical protein